MQLSRERTCRVTALAGDVHVFASSVPTHFPAVLLSLWDIAKAWQVCALSRVLILHWFPPLCIWLAFLILEAAYTTLESILRIGPQPLDHARIVVAVRQVMVQG